MRLTVGMATYDDFHGTYFTIQDLLIHHQNEIDEIVVVDNSPETQHGEMVRGLMSHQVAGVDKRYVPMPGVNSTTQSRQRAIDEATGDVVVILDCHVLLHSMVLAELRGFFDTQPGLGLYSGPLVMDDLESFVTHFNNEWRGEMWGTWGTAYRCLCGFTFSCIQNGDRVGIVDLKAPIDQEPTFLTACKCGKKFPDVPWVAHEDALARENFWRLCGPGTSDDPFDVPGFGLGLFAFRKESWPGFNPDFRLFGGEEMYIHEKYRQSGREVQCLPFLKWTHRFGRPGGAPYHMSVEGKVRNYVLGLNELGISTDRCEQHFVHDIKRIPIETFEQIAANPIAPAGEHGAKHNGGCTSCGKGIPQPSGRPMPPGDLYRDGGAGVIHVDDAPEDLFQWFCNEPRDLNEHLPKLRSLAEQCESVVEFSTRRESTVAFWTAAPERFVSYNLEVDEIYKVLHAIEEVRGRMELFQTNVGDSLEVDEIPECDLLFLDTEHNAIRLQAELDKHLPRVRRFLVLHDTHAFGEVGDDGGQGLLYTIRTLCRENPEWSIVQHTNQQYGLTVLSRLKEDKPKLPSTWQMAKNLATALAQHVATGAGATPQNEMERRLEVCSLCPYRVDDRCSVCGCYLQKKAGMESSECPLGKWEVENLK